MFSSAAQGIGLPEVFLGIIPGWGGAYLLPNLIGIENALKVVIENPLKQNRMLTADQAFEMGIADARFPAATFLEESGEALAGVAFLLAVLAGVAPRLVLPASWPLRRSADAQTLDLPARLPGRPSIDGPTPDGSL